jgi:hypothetical protein
MICGGYETPRRHLHHQSLERQRGDGSEGDKAIKSCNFRQEEGKKGVALF